MARVAVQVHDLFGEVGPATLPDDVASYLVAAELGRFIGQTFDPDEAAGFGDTRSVHRLAVGPNRMLIKPRQTLREAGVVDGNEVWLLGPDTTLGGSGGVSGNGRGGVNGGVSSSGRGGVNGGVSSSGRGGVREQPDRRHSHHPTIALECVKSPRNRPQASILLERAHPPREVPRPGIALDWSSIAIERNAAISGG